jgi:hypothetical protein
MSVCRISPRNEATRLTRNYCWNTLLQQHSIESHFCNNCATMRKETIVRMSSCNNRKNDSLHKKLPWIPLSHLLFSSVKTAVITRLWPVVITESICWRPRPCYGVKNTFEMSAHNTEKSMPARYCYTWLYRQCTCTICIRKTLFIADVGLVCSLEKNFNKDYLTLNRPCWMWRAEKVHRIKSLHLEGEGGTRFACLGGSRQGAEGRALRCGVMREHSLHCYFKQRNNVKIKILKIYPSN